MNEHHNPLQPNRWRPRIRSLSGVVTEYLRFGQAEGGVGDVAQLDRLMRALNVSGARLGCDALPSARSGGSDAARRRWHARTWIGPGDEGPGCGAGCGGTALRNRVCAANELLHLGGASKHILFSPCTPRLLSPRLV